MTVISICYKNDTVIIRHLCSLLNICLLPNYLHERLSLARAFSHTPPTPEKKQKTWDISSQSNVTQVQLSGTQPLSHHYHPRDLSAVLFCGTPYFEIHGSKIIKKKSGPGHVPNSCTSLRQKSDLNRTERSTHPVTPLPGHAAAN